MYSGQDYASILHSRQSYASKTLQLTSTLSRKWLENRQFCANLCFHPVQNFALSHNLDVTRALHPDYPIGDVASRRRLVHWFTLKRSLCSHLLKHLTGEGTSVEVARQAPQLHAGQVEGG
jgi:hypothetical protein